MANNPNAAANLKPFVKGDPRINRKGRPKSFDALRELAQAIAHEKVRTAEGATIVINGHSVTTAEAIMRKWAISRDPRLQRAFVEIAFGQVAQPLELTGKDGGPIRLEAVGIGGLDPNKDF